VLVRVEAASICGTDLHIYNWDSWAQARIHPPLIPGHEFSGAVASVGRGVAAVREGDMVSAEMHVACGKCCSAERDRLMSARTCASWAWTPTAPSPATRSFPRQTSGS